MHLNLHLCRREVVDASRFDFSFLNGLFDALDKALDGFRERQVTDDECLLVKFFYLRTHLQYATALAVVVLAHVNGAAGLEVRIEVELFTVQIADGGITNLAEIMWKNLRS